MKGRRMLSKSTRLHRRLALALAILATLLPIATAQAGGGPQNVALLVDPDDPDALAIANHYIAARGIPASNVVHLDSRAADFPAFVAFQVPALLGTLRQRGLDRQVDFVIIASSQGFFVPAPGLVAGAFDGQGQEQCPVRRFSLSGAWTLAHTADEVLAGNLSFAEPNRYYAEEDSPTAFDARFPWLDGQVSAETSARRYLLGFQLGYTGLRGNTVTDTLRLIDRSVASDGTRPAGSFYFMRNGDIRSRTRSPFFDLAIQGLARFGRVGETLDGELPLGRHDALGIMAGSPAPDIAGGDFGLLPGSWADHVTSFAATFDTGSQVKMSEWIVKGASASMGTVEEPCVFGSHLGESYHEKFPHPRLFTFYAQGLSIGESLFRSIPFTPFQGMFYGDPLTRAFAYIPQVTVPDVPTGPVAGHIGLTPRAETDRPGTSIARLALFVDGRRLSQARPGEALALDTRLLPDGPRDLRVVAYDDSPAEVQGEWRGTLRVANQPGRSLSLVAEPVGEPPEAAFRVSLEAQGEGVAELQVRKGGRILAAGLGPRLELARPLSALSLGSGLATLEGLARYADGGLVTSAPVVLELPAWASGPSTPQDRRPVAYGHQLEVWTESPILLDLPAMDAEGGVPAREILAEPAQAQLSGDGKHFLLRPAENARGPDALRFRAVDSGLPSEPATVTIRYCAMPTITRQPDEAMACPGEPVLLEVVAEGADGYQWYRDGRPIPNATEPTYRIPSLGTADEGLYQVAVYARCGLDWRELLSRSVRVVHGDCPAERCFLPWAGRGGVVP